MGEDDWDKMRKHLNIKQFHSRLVLLVFDLGKPEQNFYTKSVE